MTSDPLAEEDRQPAPGALPRPPRQASLRGLLLRQLIAQLLALSLVSGLAAYSLLYKPAMQAYDEALADAAYSIAPLLHGVPGKARLDLSPQAERVLRYDRRDRVYYLVVNPAGRPIAGELDLPPPLVAPDADGVRYYDAVYRGQAVRGATINQTVDGATYAIVVAETRHKRDRLNLELAAGVSFPALFVVLGALVVVRRAVTGGLRPLETLRSDIAQRAPSDLHPLPTLTAASELLPLVREFNQLLARLRDTHVAQRRFIGNAAHQLRTPLAALRTQIELAFAERDDMARAAYLQHCRAAADRMGRLVNQLLALSAAEPGGRGEGMMQPDDLAALLADAAPAWVARSQAHDLGLELESASVVCDRLLLQEAVGNLVDNALRYTPPGSSVTLRCGLREGLPFIEVEDDGPGLNPHDLERVGERFYRPADSPAGGSGLGLAIVHEIASRHAASVLVGHAADGHGLKVELRFPTPSSASFAATA
ncbi:MAG: sensor histidine kinase N-terminal domain-containing protein [Rhodocyclaceae bacterium]|nr:sensor histidine kinase N-terminal domain-containing protein [Rhodocyclaceae bacterium]MBX3668157.1 sensor histidine kinase N-terminal domain-containing protein [Rhodocyclaceae bacterium]